MLLPNLEQQPLYRQYDFRKTWLSSLTNMNDHSMWPLNATMISTLICPSASHAAMSLGSPSLWMQGAPTDYSFSHGADIIRALPGPEAACPGGLLHFWQQTPPATRGAFGYNSTCRPQDFRDGSSQTFTLGEKAGGLLTYGGPDLSYPTLKVEYPWAMAAVVYFAPAGQTWVVDPLAVTRDIQLPDCPVSPAGTGVPFPMNPRPLLMGVTSNERPLYSFQSDHIGGAHFLFADGNVRFLSQSIDQGIYESLSVRAACQPSETPEYLFARVLAYCLEFAEGISFGKGLAEPNEPALTVRDLTGAIKVWVEIGAPDAARLHKASQACPRVVVYTHKDPRQVLPQLVGERIHRAELVEFYSLDREMLAGLAARLDRRMSFALSVSDDHLYVTVGEETFSGERERHPLGAG